MRRHVASGPADDPPKAPACEPPLVAGNFGLPGSLLEGIGISGTELPLSSLGFWRTCRSNSRGLVVVGDGPRSA
jgi:hypothetical protein